MNEEEFRYKDTTSSITLPAVTREQIDAVFNSPTTSCEPDHYMFVSGTILWDDKTQVTQTRCCVCGEVK